MFFIFYDIPHYLPPAELFKPRVSPSHPALEITAPLAATQVVSPEQRTVTVAGGQYVWRNL